MIRRFCAKCGKNDVVLFENFCEQCYWQDNRIANPEDKAIRLNICIDCLSVKLSSGWIRAKNKEEFKYNVGEDVIKSLHLINDVKIIKIEFSDIDLDNPKPEMTIQYELSYDHITGFLTHMETCIIPVEFNWGTCPTCIRKKVGAGTVTVQIRAKNRNLTQNEKDELIKLAKKTVTKSNGDSPDFYLGSIKDKHGGLDLSFGNLSLAESFIIELNKIWNGYKEKNFKLVTEDKAGKRIYSTTFLYRIPEVITDDIVIFKEELYKVVNVIRTGVKIKSLKTHQTQTIKDWEKLVIPDPLPDTKKMLIVSKDHIQSVYVLMNLNNYNTLEMNIEDIPISLEQGEEVDFFLWEEHLILKI